MRKKTFDGEMLMREMSIVPSGAMKMDALKEAIRQADEAKQDYYRLIFRYDYASEATFHDDPPKAMPIAAEFSHIFEENPTALPEDSGKDAYLMIIQMGIDPIVHLPQIPMTQWEELMKQFYDLVKHYHVGLRTYWKQMTNFWQYIDKEKAFEYFEKFWKTGRDSLSDCRACDRSFAVRMCLLVGDRKAADEYAKPLKAGRIRFCPDTPQLYWLAYLEDALDRGDLKEAIPFANQLFYKGNRDKGDLSYLGAVLRCWAYTDLDKAIEKLTSRLEWTFGMWDQKKIYDFYKGAIACFRELAKRQEVVSLNLSKDFPLYNEENSYNCTTLADWFYNQAEVIAKRFDARNQSDYFVKNLALTCACEGQKVE